MKSSLFTQDLHLLILNKTNISKIEKKPIQVIINADKLYQSFGCILATVINCLKPQSKTQHSHQSPSSI